MLCKDVWLLTTGKNLHLFVEPVICAFRKKLILYLTLYVRRSTNSFAYIHQNPICKKKKVTLTRIYAPSVLRQNSLYFDCHSGLDPESSVLNLDSRFRGNDGFGIYVKKCWTHYTSKKAQDFFGMIGTRTKEDLSPPAWIVVLPPNMDSGRSSGSL